MAADMTNNRATISDRDMISEKVAPTLVGRVLNSFDLVVIFVALVLFVSNSSTVQFAGSAIYVFWILGFLTFLIPGALVTAQLGRMFPEEGSLYVWTRGHEVGVPISINLGLKNTDLQMPDLYRCDNLVATGTVWGRSLDSFINGFARGTALNGEGGCVFHLTRVADVPDWGVIGNATDEVAMVRFVADRLAIGR